MTLQLLTKAEAAARVRISKRTLEQLISDGTGPMVTLIGGRTFVSEAQLEQWVERSAAEKRPRPAVVPAVA